MAVRWPAPRRSCDTHAGAKFDLHDHGLGEDILVLDGTLSDEFGDYGPGTNLKNPSGSSHAPFSEGGCTLFVKLRHLSPDDSERVVIHTRESTWFRGMVEGLTVMPCLNSEPATPRWCDGRQEHISIPTGITVAKRYSSSRAYFPMSMEATLREAGFAAPT